MLCFFRSFARKKWPLRGSEKAKDFIKGKEVIHSPGATRLVERRCSRSMDNLHLQIIFSSLAIDLTARSLSVILGCKTPRGRGTMVPKDDFTEYHEELLEGLYDCVDRIVLNGYFPFGQQGGGVRLWWQKLTGSDQGLDEEHLKRMAGRFSRRVHAYAKQEHVPLFHCEAGVKKHELAAKYRPSDPKFKGLFLILVARAPALIWEVKRCKNGVPHLQRKTPWPYVNHYHFHFIDREWGHVTIKMSGQPPFGIQVMLNGHEWVERRARRETISFIKEGNCFVGGSFQALDQVADTLRAPHAIGRLAQVCDRWVYSSCLCFALALEEQERSEFFYRYSCYQLEYSRNLVFRRGTVLDEVYQGLIDRTRRLLDVGKVRTIFGWKHRPHHHWGKGLRYERVVDESTHDLTVLKIHFRHLTLKMYDKGERVLRIEAMAHQVKDLRCGRGLEKLSIMLGKLQRMVIDFLNVLCSAHLSFLGGDVLDQLPQPTQRGSRRLAGVDLQKPRMRAVSEAVLALAPQPGGFTSKEVAEKVRALRWEGTASYNPRRAFYDLMKLRGKDLVERLEKTRRYSCPLAGIRTLAGMLILREKVIKPVLAGAGKKRMGRPPKNLHPIDKHYENLQREMFNTFEMLGLAA